MAVSTDEMFAIASRYDTQLAHAMVAALRRIGVTRSVGAARHGGASHSRPDHRYDGVRECFANSCSPMDVIR